MTTNEQLAREAAFKVQVLLAIEIPNVATSDLIPAVIKTIADTYAEAMAEAERYKTLLAKTQIVMEVLAAQCLQKPYREITAELQAEIVDRCLENRYALIPIPQPPEATT